VRDIILKRFGVMKWFWNFQTNDVDVKTVDPRLIIIPRLRMDVNDPEFPYVMELQEYTREEMRDFFPDADLDKLVFGQNVGFPMPATFFNQNMAPTYQVIEVVTNEVIMWKQGTTILKKIANPYYDFAGEEKVTVKTKENGKVKRTKYRIYRNHFNYPVKNYVFFNPFMTGDAPVGEISLAEVGIPIQDDINTQKRQIINNLVKMGNGQVYIDTDALPKEIEDQITSEPGLVIIGKNLVSENRIKREPGTPLPNAHFANLQDSIASFDNVFGIHGALRGASGGSETLGGQMLNRQQDLSRIDQITRCINRGMSRVANGLVQMMKMYYDEEHLFKILGQDGAYEFIKFTQADIEDDIVIYVKSGTPPALDPVAKMNQAIQLWQLGAIDPETLFQRLEFTNPKEAAQKLYGWKNNQLVFESTLRQQEAQAGIAAKAATDAAAAGAEGADRNVETPQNVMQRAEQQTTGGGTAPIVNTPNGGQPLAVA